jgi:hypothetical protein
MMSVSSSDAQCLAGITTPERKPKRPMVPPGAPSKPHAHSVRTHGAGQQDEDVFATPERKPKRLVPPKAPYKPHARALWTDGAGQQDESSDGNTTTDEDVFVTPKREPKRSMVPGAPSKPARVWVIEDMQYPQDWWSQSQLLEIAEANLRQSARDHQESHPGCRCLDELRFLNLK